jgi:hypothetical protein
MMTLHDFVWTIAIVFMIVLMVWLGLIRLMFAFTTWIIERRTAREKETVTEQRTIGASREVGKGGRRDVSIHKGGIGQDTRRTDG